MDFIFADDSRQRRPSRQGVGPLLSIGGLYVPGEAVRSLERSIDNLCAEFGFPLNQEFKWSPGAELWMRDNLVGERRKDFFNNVVNEAALAGATALVVIEDTTYQRATNAANNELDVTRMFLERAEHLFRRNHDDGVIIVDRPGGGRVNEDKFLLDCVETIQSGTQYVKPERIALNALSGSSRLLRILQIADIITGCTTSLVAGEARYAPVIFSIIKRILYTENGRIGGVGLKIHPDFRYVNLYHWLLGDEYFWRFQVGTPLPMPKRPYHASANIP
jgi:uncharacterized protein DUF3800